MAIQTRPLVPIMIMGKVHAVVRFHEYWRELDTPFFTRSGSFITNQLYYQLRDSRAFLDELKRLILTSGTHYYSRVMGVSNEWELAQLGAELVVQERLYILVEPVSERTVYRPDIQVKNEDLIDRFKSILNNSKEIINPRWEHFDEEIAGKRPDTTFVGDRVLLKVDVADIPDGTNLDFDVLSVGSGHEELISARGKVCSGTASVEWKTVDPRADGDENEIKVIFSARSGNGESENCNIPISKGNLLGRCIDIIEEPITDLTFEIFTNGESVHTGSSDSNGDCFSPYELNENTKISFPHMEYTNE